MGIRIVNKILIWLWLPSETDSKQTEPQEEQSRVTHLCKLQTN